MIPHNLTKAGQAVVIVAIWEEFERAKQSGYHDNTSIIIISTNSIINGSAQWKTEMNSQKQRITQLYYI